MAERKTLKSENGTGGNYFASPKTDRTLISSGATLLDCVLGGGYMEGRVCNIVGDKSSGKTLLAIEACANIALSYPNAQIKYREAEAAFDPGYAEAIGMPVNRVDFGEQQLHTVEDMFDDISDVLKNLEKDEPALYIIDSLDALSDRAELERKFDEATYGQSKPKQLSELFRRLTREIEKKRMSMMVISQVRDNIGVSFGKKHTRSGGKALDFYASQILWLSHIGYRKKSKNNIERPVGIDVRCRCEKNKIGLPMREVDIPVIFGFGIDDLRANLDFLKKIGKLDELNLDEKFLSRYENNTKKMTDEEFDSLSQEASKVAEKHWYEIEQEFLPTRTKYKHGS